MKAWAQAALGDAADAVALVAALRAVDLSGALARLRAEDPRAWRSVTAELDASRAGKLLAKRPSAGAGDEAAAGAGGGGGDDAGRAPPSSIGRLAGRVRHVGRSMAMH